MPTIAARIELSPIQFCRIVRDLRRIAKEEGAVRWIKGGMYFFGSEVANLRLLAHHRKSDDARQGYSTNLGIHYFCLEMKNLTGEALECAANAEPGV